MLMHARRFWCNPLLSLMSSACLLRPSPSAQAFLLTSISTATTRTSPTTAAAAAAATGLANAIMGKKFATATTTTSSRRVCSKAPRSSSGGSSNNPLLSSMRPRVPRLFDSAAASSSSLAASPGGDTTAPSPKADQNPPQAEASGEGLGFGSKPAGQQQQQQQQQQQHRRPKQQRRPQPKAPPRGDNLLVVGLGNPGDKYKMTRHNAGFLVAEELARRHGGTLKIKTAFQGEYCSVRVKDKSVGILRPITYMNNSGMSARKVMDFFKLPKNAAIVLVDEVALDFGQLRLKGKGGAGGHNGLKSLQAHLKTPEYTRLRIGVGASKFSEALSDHVLGEFTRTEKKELDNVIADACDAVEHWIEEEDMAKVMTRFNSAR